MVYSPISYTPFCATWFRFTVILLLLVFTEILNAQTSEYKHPATYALVVGISDYQHEGITDLDFADRDAGIFASWLQSPSGGLVPPNHIVFLKNEEATHTAIYHALDWLIDSCKKNDTVYIFFSGHGDVENNDVYKDGFLLTYNTPRQNYLNFSLSVGDLNFYANYLTLQTQAQLILITDACHSGFLAGNAIKGKYLVAEQMRMILNKEIRLNSCTGEQLSNEDKDWGGGRGIFSYYLINGLNGLADQEKDKKISMREIQHYVDSCMHDDPLLKAQRKKQTPVFSGNNDFILAQVDSSALKQIQNESSLQLTAMAVSPPAYALFFETMSSVHAEDVFDFESLVYLPREVVPDNMMAQWLAHFPDKRNELEQMKAVLKKNPDARRRFTDKIVDLLDKRTQEVIELYLEGNEAELERRRYYSMMSGRYEVYPMMLQIAIRLTSEKKPLYRSLSSKFHYFTGVVARIRLASGANADSILQLAFREQHIADSVLPDAAYIQNELGILFFGTGKYKQADSCFNRARKIAPQWAMPWANLTSLYAHTKQFEKGLESSKKAIELAGHYSSAFVNTGFLYEQLDNQLLAEEMYRRAIALNNRHYLPFERLAYVCLKTHQFALADSFFFEADIRKKGFHIVESFMWVEGVFALPPQTSDSITCQIPKSIGAKDVITHFMAALVSLQKKDTVHALSLLKKVMVLDPKNALAFHEAGALLWKMKRWAEADIYLGLAKKYWLSDSTFLHTCDSLKQWYSLTDTCMYYEYTHRNYDPITDYYLHGSVLEQWNHASEALENYQEAIRRWPDKIPLYYKKWNLFESLERYEESETCIRQIPDDEKRKEYLHSFYHRVCEHFPESGPWHYKAGNYMYSLASSDTVKYKGDRSYRISDYTIRTDYDEETEFFDDVEVNKKDSLTIKVNNIMNGIHERSMPQDYIPGTGEVYYTGMPIAHPFTDGIAFLKKASLYIDFTPLRSEINEKLGDLFNWKGIYQKSPDYYRQAVYATPHNAGQRIKLIQSLHRNYLFGEALLHMDTLNQRQELNYDILLLLSRYQVLAGQGVAADSLLKIVENIHPYENVALNQWRGLLYSLNGDATKAVTCYKLYRSKSSEEWTTSYAIARCYAMQKKEKEAFQWLNQSINEGFHSGWVLRNDASWKPFQKNIQWARLLDKIKPSIYRAATDGQ